FASLRRHDLSGDRGADADQAKIGGGADRAGAGADRAQFGDGQVSERAASEENVESIAARWFARRRSGEMSAEESTALEAWLEADAAHKLAFDVVARSWARAGVMRTAPEILTLRARHRRSRNAWARYAPRALAAGLALLAISGASLL